MVLVDFNNCPGVVSFVRGRSSLVLHSDLVTDAKRWEEFGMFLPFFVIDHVPVFQGLLSG